MSAAPLPTIEGRVGYLCARPAPRITGLDHALATNAAIDEALIAHGAGRLLMDNRDTERPDESLRAILWTWLSAAEHFHRVAILIHDPRTAARINRTAARNRAEVRAFNVEAEAVAWLVG